MCLIFFDLDPLCFTALNLLNGFQAFWGSQIFYILLSAFSGALFAGIITNYFEINRKISDSRREKYNEHRNTIVQIEQEQIPARINLSRNLASLEDAVKNTTSTQVRLVLRFYDLFLSPNLGLRLLNLDLINKYAELYILFETINSDIKYVNSLIEMIKDGPKNPIVYASLLKSYETMLPYLLEKCKEADEKSLALLSLSKLAFDLEDKKKKREYIKTGKDIKYKINEKEISMKKKSIEKEETAPYKKGEKRPQFFAPYLDIITVIQPAPAPN